MTDLVEPVRAEVRPGVEQVAETFVALMRTFVKARSRLMAAAEHDVEWSAHLLLKTVHNGGPMRAGAIAESVQSDPSTVSRQVATLVKDGLLERRADPLDGRAALLAITERGLRVLADQDQVRLRNYADMLSGWTDSDLERFTGLLRRFTDDYETANEHWLNERIGRGAARSGGDD